MEPPQMDETIPMPEGARCMGCGYTLARLTRPVCPECGRGFDPKDVLTFVGTSQHDFFRLGARGPGWIMLGCTGLGVLSLFYGLSFPGAMGKMGWTVWGGLLVAAAGWTYFTQASIWLVRLWRHRHCRLRPQRNWRWWSVPVAWVVCLLALQLHLPKRVGWWIASGELEQIAQQLTPRVPGSYPSMPGVERAGWYEVRPFQRVNSTVVIFVVQGTGTFGYNQGAWVYAPQGLPNPGRVGPYQCRPLYGDWYAAVKIGQ